MPEQRKKRAQHTDNAVPFFEEEPIPAIYPAIDNDLARDNLENDIPEADLQDL